MLSYKEHLSDLKYIFHLSVWPNLADMAEVMWLLLKDTLRLRRVILMNGLVISGGWYMDF